MKHFVLSNTMLWIGDGSAFEGHVVINDDTIESVGRGGYQGNLPVTDVKGLRLSPGMIDLMVLGGFGRSILRDDPLDIAREYLRLGVTSCQLCIGTLSWEAMKQVKNNTRKTMNYQSPDAAQVHGLYLEGPFQQPDLTGASQRHYALPPSAENVDRIFDELGDVVTMVNVSPGTEGDARAVHSLRAAGKVVSMAHSNAKADRVLACIESGTSVLGHIWDNNAGLIGDSGVQQPTIEHVALIDERVRFIHLICDGTHVHPLMIKLVLRCRGIRSICLVTDSIPRAGCPDGEFLWDDGRHFIKKDGVGRTDKGWLAGSGLLLPDDFRNFVNFTGMAPHEAICAVTLNPARSLGLDEQVGQIAPGRMADLIAWDDKLRVSRVWHKGHEIDEISQFGEVQLAGNPCPK